MKIIIDRFDGTKKYESTYELTNEEIKGKTLLTVLFDIKQKKDATLNFTASCRSAICGACAVRVNGHSYLACDTKMNELLAEYGNPDTIRISPLVGFSKPAISLNIVVFPQPEGPNKVINSPSLNVSVKGFKTSTSPKDLLISFIVIVDIFPPKLKTYLL